MLSMVFATNPSLDVLDELPKIPRGGITTFRCPDRLLNDGESAIQHSRAGLRPGDLHEERLEAGKGIQLLRKKRDPPRQQRSARVQAGRVSSGREKRISEVDTDAQPSHGCELRTSGG